MSLTLGAQRFPNSLILKAQVYIQIFNFFTFIKMTQIVDEEIKYRIIPYLCKYITIFHNVHEDGIELALLTNDIYKLI